MVRFAHSSTCVITVLSWPCYTVIATWFHERATPTGLAEDEVVRTEELTEGARANGVHGTRLQVPQDGAGDVAPAGGRLDDGIGHLEALQLEALQTVVTLSLLTDDIEDGVDELGTLGVVTLGPVVTGTLR